MNATTKKEIAKAYEDLLLARRIAREDSFTRELITGALRRIRKATGIGARGK